MPVRSGISSSRSRYTRIDAEQGIALQYISRQVSDEQNHGASSSTDTGPAGDHGVPTSAAPHAQRHGDSGISRLVEHMSMSSTRLLRQGTSGSPLRNSLTVIPTTPDFVDIDLSLGSETHSYRTGGSISFEANEPLHRSLRSPVARNIDVSYDDGSRVHLCRNGETPLEHVRPMPLLTSSRIQFPVETYHWPSISIHVFQPLRDAFQEMAARVMRPGFTQGSWPNQLTGPAAHELLMISAEATHEVLEVRSTPVLQPTAESSGQGERHPSLAELPSEQHRTHVRIVNAAYTTRNKLQGILLSGVALVVADHFTFVLIILQSCIVVTETALGLATQGRSLIRPVPWTTFTLVVIFALFTVEVGNKAVASGFMFNRDERGLSDRTYAYWVAIIACLKSLMRLSNQEPPSGGSLVSTTKSESSFMPHVLQDTSEDTSECAGVTEEQTATERAFLRRPGSFLDLLAITSFWLDVLFGSLDIHSTGKLGLLRALSCLRMARLLNLTKGTLAITRKIKRIALMVSLIALLIAFYCLLFAIAGVHSFGSGMSRRCVWDGTRADPTQDNTTITTQLCDRWWTMKETEMIAMPWLNRDGLSAVETYGGYICPLGSWCVEGDSLYEGISGFDSLWGSLVMVFILLTGRSFTDTMYSLTESNGLAAVIYFFAGFVILRLWLINLFVAIVITSSQTSEEASHSNTVVDQENKIRPSIASTASKRFKPILEFGKRLKDLPVVAIVFNMVFKSLRNDTMDRRTADLIWWSEVSTVLILDIEIALRFFCRSRPHRRSLRDWTDLIIAVVTTGLLVPILHHSGRLYDWLSVMQVMRAYRVVLAFSVVRTLTTPLIAHVPDLFNLILYIMMSSIFVAVLTTQLFFDRSIASDENPDVGPPLDLATIHGALLSIYRVAVSETWSNVLLDAIRYDSRWYSVFISVASFFAWFVVVSLMILNMFIASVQKAFQSDEEQKRLQQVRGFLQQRELGHATPAIHAYFKRQNNRPPGQDDFGSISSDTMLRDSVMRDFLDDVDDSDDEGSDCVDLAKDSAPSFGTNTLHLLGDLWRKRGAVLFDMEPNPFYSGLKFTKAVEDLAPSALAKEVVEISENQTIAQRQYLLSHPHYDTSLFLFPQGSRFRNLCQMAVRPGRGHARYQGVTPGPVSSFVFSVFGYMLIISMVIIACVVTPLYKVEYFAWHGYYRKNEFVFIEIGFASLFTLEAFVRVVADGFFWTPNAYLQSFWGVTDVIAILSMWINAILLLEVAWYGAQAIGAFKALKVLRLLEIKDKTIRNYTSAFISGKRSLIAIVILASGLLSAFAIWGLQLFSGRTYSCNDSTSSMTVLTNCVGEYVHAPYEWTLLLPRHIDVSHVSFNDFASSMLTIFRSTSESTWLDEHTGVVFAQPTVKALSGLDAFFLIYKLLSGILVVTLLVTSV